MAGLGAILRTLGNILPPWAIALVAAALLVVYAPTWVDNMRVKQIRGAVRRMVRADESTRGQLVHEALELAGRRSGRLVVVVEQASKYDQRALRDQALSILGEVDAAEAARLRALLKAEGPKTVLHPIEVAVNVERLLGEGLVSAARQRLDEGLARHPEDPDLVALLAKVEAAERSAQA